MSVHLHVHTIYSIGRSTVTIKEAADAGTAVAITDRATLSGVLKFQKECNKTGTKPIFGMEIYLFHSGRVYHLTLLCKNLTGYKNLMTLSSVAYKSNLHKNYPCVDYQMLWEKSEGLICLTGDLGSPVSRALLDKDKTAVKYHMDKLFTIFSDSLYVELISHGLREQEYVCRGLKKLASMYGLKCVRTDDVHYAKSEHALKHAVLVADRMKRHLDPEWALYHGVTSATFHDRECDVAKEIADRCDVVIPTGVTYLPHFDMPEGFSSEFDYLCMLAWKGLRERVPGEPTQEYKDRLSYELSVINDMGFPGYFLIVEDFVKFAHNNNISVGPGRGSGAGSLVAYVLRITNLDPIVYKLLFERFLNPDRVSMPDFDIDFCYFRRLEVIEYLKEKYGHDSVSSIGTFGKMKAKAAWKTVARTFGVSQYMQDAFSKALPSFKALTEEDEKNLYELVETETMQEFISEHPEIKEVVDLACEIEGPFRSRSKHAAGIVLSQGPIENYVPVFVDDGEIATQFDMKDVEAAGLVKFDFLGLKTLSIIASTCDAVDGLDIDTIPLDHAETFELIASGHTVGMFQIESHGMKNLMMNLQPDNIEDIIAAVALYRPGPMGSGMLDDYVESRHGRKEVIYKHPDLEPILGPTFGVILYQEQIMQIAQKIAGFKLSEADLLRRAMGKKRPSEMLAYEEKFISGAVEAGYEKSLGKELFDLINFFSGYGFNRSHSAAYGLIAYQTAWLKCNYPAEFLAATVHVRNDKVDIISLYVREAKRMDIEIEYPNVNTSSDSSRGKDGKLYLGLDTIKGVGKVGRSAIVKHQPFEDLPDLAMRTKIGKRDLDALMFAGALDCLLSDKENINLARASIDVPLLLKTVRAKSNKTLEDIYKKKEVYTPKRISAWSTRTLLENEMKHLGYYRSGHPTDCYSKELDFYGCVPVSSWERSGIYFKLGCVVHDIKVYVYYREEVEKRMAWITVSDSTGMVEATVFHSLFEQKEPDLRTGDVLVLDVKRDLFKGKASLIVNDIRMLSEERLRHTTSVVVFDKEMSGDLDTNGVYVMGTNRSVGRMELNQGGLNEIAIK